MKPFGTIILVLLFLQTLPLSSQTEKTTLTYSRQEAMIPMRDKTRLFTVIYRPDGVNENLPFLFLRTPYGVYNRPSPDAIEYVKDMAAEGYIFVFQDIRGRFRSEGVFEMQRPTRDKKDPGAIDESTDTWDTIEWLIRNVSNNNGKVGMFGTSYDGWTTMMGTIDPHPALKAASEHATPADMYIGDDFHHNGAFRLSYSFEYAYMTENTKESSLFPFGKYDTYEWYLDLGPLSNVNEKYFHGKLPSWNNFAAHPDYDDFWKRQSMAYRLGKPVVPLLHVAGWWDQEDFYGPLKAYEVLEKEDRNNMNFILIGPWNHGGWRSGSGDKLGNINFGEPTAEKFRKDFQAPFFAYYLKGRGTGSFPEAITFQTGRNIWRSYDKWPPVNITRNRNLYLNAGGRLSFSSPTDQEGYDEYISDPARPVPYRSRPVEVTYGPGSRWYTWLVEDQRFVHNRPDVLSWQTEVLESDVVVTGNLSADIFASTSGTDFDLIVKLIDVYPGMYPSDPKMGGYQLMVANDVFRCRYRKDFASPEPVDPGEINEYIIDLHAIDHVFQTGHKIMVQIQSTWFPIIDRNPQKYLKNIFEATDNDFIKTIQKVHRSVSHPSHIKLSVSE